MPDRQEAPRVLIVISSMAIGGPQKALIGMLQRLDPASVAVDIMILKREPGQLFPWLPSYVRVIEAPASVVAATLPREEFLWSLCTLALSLRPPAFLRLARELAKGVTHRRGWQQVRQRAWHRISGDLQRVPGHYDAAFGILGLSTYAVVDLVDARFKYHWIRSDTRVLARDETIDGAYYAQLAGGVSVSEQCAQIFESMYPTVAGRVVVYKNDIPNNIQIGKALELSSSDEDVRVLLTVSRLDRLKGIDLAIEACALLVSRGHRVKWVVLGDGRERPALERLVEDHGLNGVFLLPGSTLATGPYLDVANVYVHPSLTEGRSNAVEEAKARGKAIVATAYETVGDQVQDGVTGLVCPIDPTSIADAVERLLVSPDLGRRLGEEAKRAYGAEVCDPNILLRSLSCGELPDFTVDVE